MEGIVGRDFVKEVTCDKSFEWDTGGDLSRPFSVPALHFPLPRKPQARFIIWSLLILEPSVQSIETYETAGSK